MRRILTTICALILAALCPAAVLVSRGLPADTGSYVEKKYAGWNGVLQAWVCCEWSGGGSLISWLKECAADFEKTHSGVYIEFTTVKANGMREMMAGDARRPELVFFSPGVLNSAAGLKELDMPSNLRDELQLDSHALPAATGGYIWVYNTMLADGVPVRGEDLSLVLPVDGSGCRYSPAAIALLSDAPGETGLELPDAGVDLGLPANAQAGMITADADALDRFISGELPWTIVNQAGLARLNRLREDGREPDWACAPTGQFAWADQLLLAGLAAQGGNAAAQREALAEEFIASLYEEKAQAALADAGAFSVTGERVHSAFSVYAELDALLAGLPLAAAEPFSEHSQIMGAAIVREYCAGECSEKEAFAGMGLNLTLPIHPN